MDAQIDTSIRKTYYSISEVCARTNLEPHVLRYWESEFPQLRPKKNRAGNRAYRDKDIDVIEYIKFLLYDQQYTIPGAKKKLIDMKESESPLVRPDISVPADALSPVEVATTTQNTVPHLPADVHSAVLSELKELLDFLRR